MAEADRLRRRWAAAGTSVAVAAMWLVYTQGRPWRLFARDLLTSDFFDAQARALLHGHLDVPPDVVTIEGFTIGDKTHMYFGIVPAILRMPFHAVVDDLDGRLSLLSILVATVLLCLASTRLARLAEVCVRGEAADEPGGARWYAVIAAAPVLLTPVLYLAAAGWVYHEAILWGTAAAVWGLLAVVVWWCEPTRRHLAIALLAGIVAVGSRPTSGLAPILAMLACGGVLAQRRRWVPAAEIGGAALLAFATSAIVNLARFGQLVGAPFERQVANSDPVQSAATKMTHGRLLHPEFLLSNVARYLSPSPGVMRPTRLFPFVEWGPLPTPVVAGSPMHIEPTGSLPTAAPLMLALAAVGVWWLVRGGAPRWWWFLVAPSGLAVLATLFFWATTHRYLGDFVPLLVVLAAPAWWIVRRWAGSLSPRLRASVLGLVVVVALVGMAGQAGLALWMRHNFVGPDPSASAEFMRFRYRVDAMLHPGSAPPSVFRSDGDLLPDTYGAVVIVGDCDALYYRTLSWQLVEARSGGSHRALLLPDSATLQRMATEAVVVGTGTLWRLESRPIFGDTARLVYVSGGVDVTTGDPFELDDGLLLDVVAVPPQAIVTVSVAGRDVFVAWPVGASGFTPADGFTTIPTEPRFCQSLADRLPDGLKRPSPPPGDAGTGAGRSRPNQRPRPWASQGESGQ